MPAAPRLMLVTDRRLTLGRPLEQVLRMAVTGGVDAIQVREKDLSEPALLDLVRTIAAGASPARVLVNGHPTVARLAGAGLHLPERCPAPADRRWPLWGRSVHSAAAAMHAAGEGVDYVLAGTVFASESKPGAAPLTCGGLMALVERVPGLPVLAIGGVVPALVPEVLAAGAWGVAVQRAVLSAPDPEAAARALRQALP